MFSRDGDSLITGLNAKVVVVFYNGNQLPIGAQSEVLLDESVTFKHGPYDDADVNQIAALQKIIVDGIRPCRIRSYVGRTCRAEFID